MILQYLLLASALVSSTLATATVKMFNSCPSTVPYRFRGQNNLTLASLASLTTQVNVGEMLNFWVGAEALLNIMIDSSSQCKYYPNLCHQDMYDISGPKSNTVWGQIVPSTTSCPPLTCLSSPCPEKQGPRTMETCQPRPSSYLIVICPFNGDTRGCSGAMVRDSKGWTCVDLNCEGTMQQNGQGYWTCRDPRCPGTMIRSSVQWTCQDKTCTGTMQQNYQGNWECQDSSCKGSMIRSLSGWLCQDASCPGNMYHEEQGVWRCQDVTCPTGVMLYAEGSWTCSDTECTGKMSRGSNGWACFDHSCNGVMKRNALDASWSCIDTRCTGSMRRKEAVWACYDETCTGSMSFEASYDTWSCADRSCLGKMNYDKQSQSWMCNDSSCTGQMKFQNGTWECVKDLHMLYIIIPSALILVGGLICWWMQRSKSQRLQQSLLKANDGQYSSFIQND